MRSTLSSSASKLLAAVVCVAVTAQSAVAQAKPATTTPAFGMGYTDIGPTLGLGGLGGASADFGGRFEHAIKALPDMGNGMLGIQVAAEYYSWSTGNSLFNYSVKYIPIGVTANYHFNIAGQPKFDPFVGLGLGYNVVTCSGNFGNIGCGYSSGIYFVGRAGARYFFAPKMAGYADVGAGGATLNVGLMFKLM
jgi:hypothetical protein